MGDENLIKQLKEMREKGTSKPSDVKMKKKKENKKKTQEERERNIILEIKEIIEWDYAINSKEFFKLYQYYQDFSDQIISYEKSWILGRKMRDEVYSAIIKFNLRKNIVELIYQGINKLDKEYFIKCKKYLIEDFEQMRSLRKDEGLYFDYIALRTVNFDFIFEYLKNTKTSPYLESLIKGKNLPYRTGWDKIRHYLGYEILQILIKYVEEQINYFEIYDLYLSHIKLFHSNAEQKKYNSAFDHYLKAEDTKLKIKKSNLAFDLEKKEDTQNLIELVIFNLWKNIKETILNLATRFTRLEIREISEKCSIDHQDLIIEVIKNMINNKEIYAEYFSSSKSIAFDQQANIKEIDKLISIYKDWEEKKIGKK